MAWTGPMEDRLAIRELYDSYADAASRADRAAWLGCYTKDARWKTHYFDLTGIDAIAQQYDAIGGDVTDTLVHTQVFSIEVDGDSATCRALQIESLLYANGATYELAGLYEDELVREGGQWLFKYRNYLVKREKAPDVGL
ncbi:MAG: nuclear transport factor 2 family protein [Sphingomonadaceae bacterium]